MIIANQVALAVSLWCRVIEAARKLQQDMGYASYGHSTIFTSFYGNSKRTSAYYGKSSKQEKSPYRAMKRQSKADLSRAEDEIELRPTDRGVTHTTVVEGGNPERGQPWTGIAVSREYGYSTSTDDQGGDSTII